MTERCVLLFQDVPEFQQMTVTTEDDEKYKCIIPQMQVQEKEKKYNGVIGTNPLDLLSVLFKQSSCSHKVSSQMQEYKIEEPLLLATLQLNIEVEICIDC